MPMLKEYASVSIGITTLLVAVIAAYGITTANTQTQDKQQPITIPDYSDELAVLHSEIRTVKEDLTILNTLKDDIYTIQEQLVELEKKSTQIEKIVVTPRQVTLDLDKSVYLPGDTIKITSTGIEPQKMVQIQFLNGDFILLDKETWSDSTGKILYSLRLSTTLPSGNYQVKLISDNEVRIEQITIQSNQNSNTNSISTDSYIFTVKTDKSIYQRGEIIEVTGTGKPNTAITGTLTSPTGKAYTTTSSTQSDGKYVMFFIIQTNAEKGKWHITTNHIEKTIVVSINIE